MKEFLPWVTSCFMKQVLRMTVVILLWIFYNLTLHVQFQCFWSRWRGMIICMATTHSTSHPTSHRVGEWMSPWSKSSISKWNEPAWWLSPHTHTVSHIPAMFTKWQIPFCTCEMVVWSNATLRKFRSGNLLIAWFWPNNYYYLHSLPGLWWMNPFSKTALGFPKRVFIS